ncbi:site-specific integrase [Hymenobacter sp. BT559]|uniref:site-specific integrase n=1 Tax=Hymenobacter sp. BT559 TaxID=2795729 RepID=UPI0018EDDCB7|nr:site-specific integrase [Hymenobacter sp. BT559]MBJ6141799.1 site-specific integrase [Hymenobacter sp. BT559]
MASVSFLLKEPNATKTTPIFAFLSFDGKRAKIYTGLSILPKQWLKADQRAQVRGLPDNGKLNDALELAEERLLACYREHRAQGLLPTTEVLRAAIEPAQVVAPVAAQPGPTFWGYFDEWIAVTRSQAKIASAKVYATVARHLRDYERTNKYAVDFDTITLAFGDRYASHLLHTVRLTDNTVAKQILTLKRFLRWSRDRGYTDATGFDRLSWKRQEPDIMTLTAGEVAALEQLELPASSYLDNARALFLLACYTGLRFSDLVSIRAEHLRGQTLRLKTQKTREIVTVPLRTEALVIVERLLAGEVRPITNQKLNDYLKELGQLASIDAPVEVVRFRGGVRESTTVAKWERLGCHTGRRTFVTLSLERGLRPETIMKVTGHRGWRSFQRYVNVTSDTVEREFRQSWGQE